MAARHELAVLRSPNAPRHTTDRALRETQISRLLESQSTARIVWQTLVYFQSSDPMFATLNPDVFAVVSGPAFARRIADTLEG